MPVPCYKKLKISLEVQKHACGKSDNSLNTFLEDTMCVGHEINENTCNIAENVSNISINECSESINHSNQRVTKDFAEFISENFYHEDKSNEINESDSENQGKRFMDSLFYLS